MAQAGTMVGASLFGDQWRMSRMQVYNWGTFCGYHDFPMMQEDAQGNPAVIMITGESGTGKSTLLDAKTAVLMPYNVRFNAASNRTTKGRARSQTERNVYSYLMGQQDNEVDEDTGETRERFLRDRARSNWSAIVLTFDAAEGGGQFAAARFYYVTANSQRNEYRTLYVTADHDLDPRLMERVAAEPFTAGMLRQVYADATVYDGVTSFLHATYQRLQIGSGESGRNAMRLHEQIQAGYSVEDVDGLFKTLVLDEPTTYEHALKACDAFDEREETWTRMREAQEKAEALSPIRDLYANWENRHAEAVLLAGLGAGDDLGPLALWICRREAQVCAWSREEETAQAESLERQISEKMAKLEEDEAELKRVSRAVMERGGAEIDRLREDMAAAQNEKRRRHNLCDVARDKLAETDYELPLDEVAYERLSGELAEAIAQEETVREALEERRTTQVIRTNELKTQLEELKDELEHYRGQRGLMPKRLTDIRDRMARLLELTPDDLPFAGELMDLCRDAEEWRVAANVGYHGLARTVLVDERRLRDFSVRINGIHLGFRLNFEGVDLSRHYDAADADNDMLSSKLVFRDDSPFVEWLREEVGSSRRDFVCVDDPNDLDGSEAQITREGQTRKGRRGAHGHSQDSLVIGFENSGRVRSLSDSIDETVGLLARENEVYMAIQAQDRQIRVVHDAAMWVQEHSFSEIYEREMEQKIEDLAERLRQLESSDDLQKLIKERERLEETVNAHHRTIGALDSRRESHEKRSASLLSRIEMLDARERLLEVAGTALGKAQETKLEKLAAEHEQSYLGETWEMLAQNYDRVRGGMESQIRRELTDAKHFETQYKNSLEQIFNRYRAQWLGEDSDVGTSVESYPDYLEMLEQLEADELTREVADVWLSNLFKQTAGSLVTLLNAYREDLRGTRGRIDQINDIMGGFKFGPEGGHLTINQRDTHLADIERLQSELRGWTGYATAERERRFTSREHEELRSFMGRLREDLAGNVHPLLNTHRLVKMSVTVTWPPETGRGQSSFDTLSAKSGGETQELVAFILGAALLYCLGNNLAGKPSFSPVFLDEAFIKADDRYTRRAIKALVGLGFQVIIAVPTNKVQEVVPVANQYVCVTKRRSDGHSYVLPMEAGDAVGEGVGDGEGAMGDA